MICIVNNSLNPYFNLATEAFLLDNFPQGFVMIWQNQNAVVLGKHQNALAEVNLEKAMQFETNIARRISGGGTVVHDMGNVNFTIALPLDLQQHLIDFKKFINPVIEFLQSIGVNAYASGRNDILVQELKISGNAEHHFRKNKLMLHHGTLLFNSDLKKLSQLLKTTPLKYKDKAVQSNRSKVTNISNFLSPNYSLEDFKIGLQQYLCNAFDVQQVRTLQPDEIAAIKKQVTEKFETDDWNFGYSPAYSFNHQFSWEESTGNITLNVERDSRIIEANIAYNSAIFSKLQEKLIGTKHYPEIINSMLHQYVPIAKKTKWHPLLFYFF